MASAGAAPMLLRPGAATRKARTAPAPWPRSPRRSGHRPPPGPALGRLDDLGAFPVTVAERGSEALVDEKNAALQDLLDHADTHSQLIDEVIKYQTDHGNFAKPPAIAAVASDDEPPPTPTKRRSSRTREPKQ